MIKDAIILVAGKGTRLKPLTLHTHKCLTKVNGKEILFNALDKLAGNGIRHVTLVVGYLGDTIRAEVGSDHKGMSISYVENDIFDITNTSYSLLLGLKDQGEYDELFVLEGDVFFSDEIFRRLTEDSHVNATLLEPYRPDLDGTFVELNDEGFVADWTHKSMREAGYEVESKYKTINLHKFSKEFVDKVLFPDVEEICREKEGKEPLENVMRKIVREDHDAVYGVLSGGMKWYEIDDIDDLHRAESIFTEN